MENIFVINFSDIEREIVETGNWDKVLYNLRQVVKHLDTIGVDTVEVLMLISRIERMYSEDFWSGWVDYENDSL